MNKEDRVSGYNNQSGSFDDFDRQDGSGGGLRKQLEDALAELKELRSELGREKRDETAEALLKDKGLDPALKGLIPPDVDPQQWVDQYAPLLGAKPQRQEAAPAQEQAKEEPKSEEPQVEFDPALAAEREALELIQGASDAGSPAHLTGDVLERMNKIQNEDELLKFFQSNGA